MSIMSMKIPLTPDEKEKIYTRDELYTLAVKYKAKVIAGQIVKTNRYQIVDTVSGGDDFVLWMDKYGTNDFIIRNLIIAESVPVN